MFTKYDALITSTVSDTGYKSLITAGSNSYNFKLVSDEDILLLFNQYLDSCHDADITCELVDGFSMLILHGRFFDEKIMSKLIVMFFNANIEPKVVQILGIFFETLISQKKQKCLQLSLFETLTAIATDETLIENTLSLVLKFFVHAMEENKEIDDSNAVEREHFHNGLATTLLTWMNSHSADHKSLSVISKEILCVKVSANEESRLNLMNLVDDLLLQKSLHKRTEKNLKLFKQMIETEGTEPLQFSSIRPADGVEEEDGISNPNEDSDTEIEPEPDLVLELKPELEPKPELKPEINENCNGLSIVLVNGKENRNHNVRKGSRMQDSLQNITKHRREDSGKRMPLFTLV